MNTDAEYRRLLQPAASTSPEDPVAEDARHLGIHGDPSRHGSPSGPTTLTGRQIAWVRPTELHSYADRLIGRGIDLQSELTRRARAIPRTTTNSVRRAAPPLARRGPNAADVTQEGIEL